MNYTFSNEELLFLCALINGHAGTGIENTLENETEESIAEKWKVYEPILIQKGYLHYNTLHQLKMNKEIGVIVKLITEAEYTFCCLKEDSTPEMQYIYYDKNKAMHMINEEGICEVEYFSDYEPFKEKLCDVLRLQDIVQGEESYFIHFPAGVIDKVLELEEKGQHEEAMGAFSSYGLTDLEREHLIGALVKDDQDVMNIKAVHQKLIKGKEVLFKIARMGHEVWLMRSELEGKEPQVYVYKLSQEEMITSLFNF